MVDNMEISPKEISESFFFDNIRSENIDLRLCAISHIREICRKLGVSKTLSIVFPLMRDLTKEIDEDIRSAVLDQLKDFEGIIGEENISILLTLLESFLSSDDTSIRNRAVEIVNDLSKKINENTSCEIYVPFVVELLNNDWFTARMSGIALWPSAYQCKNNKRRNDLLSKLIELAKDKIMSIRRIFVMSLIEIFDAIGEQIFIEILYPTVMEFFKDPLDPVKMSVIDSFVILLPRLASYEYEFNKIFTELRELCSDKSWRVRYTLILKYPQIKNAVKSKEIQKELMEDFDRFLEDNEPEVRMAGASILSKMFNDEDGLEEIDRFFTQNMWDRIENLITEGEAELSSTLVEQIGDISEKFSANQYKQYFVPFLERVLSHHHPDVKLKGLSIISKMGREFNLLEQNLVDSLHEMASNNLWRVRYSLVEHISTIASSMNFNNSTTNWTDWICEMLNDEANAVRESTVNVVIQVMKQLSHEWIEKFIRDRHTFYNECNSYLLRITTIFLFQQICLSTDIIPIQTDIIKKFIDFSNDPVANVRINIAKSFLNIHSIVDKLGLQSDVITCLKAASQDSDPDVTDFAKKSLSVYV